MKRFKVNMCIFIVIFTISTLSCLSPAHADEVQKMELCIGGMYNVYAPSVLTYKGTKRMWMGGWLKKEEKGLDRIYFTYKRRGKWLPPQPVQWTNNYPVPGQKPGYTINDPSVIKHPQHDWLFMYYTALSDWAVNAAIDAVANRGDPDWTPTCVGFASSIDGGYTWWDHGIILSTSDGVWSPSAIVMGEEIWIYYNTASSPAKIYRQRLEINGWKKIGPREEVIITENGNPVWTANVDVSKCGDKLILVANAGGIKDIGKFESAEGDGLNFVLMPWDAYPLVWGGPNDNFTTRAGKKVAKNNLFTPHVEVLNSREYILYFGFATYDDVVEHYWESDSIHAWTFTRNPEFRNDTIDAGTSQESTELKKKKKSESKRRRR